MKKIRAILIDDAPQARRLLRLMLQELAPDVEICGEGENVEEGLAAIRSLSPDVVFLDIEMPGKSGLSLVKELQQESLDCAIVFTTAYNEYALQAFRLSAIDYLLKPIQESQLEETLVKIREQQQLKQAQTRLQALERNLEIRQDKLLCIPVNYGYDYVPVQDIEYIEADGAYAHIFLRDKKQITVSKNLKYFETALQELPFFVKAHRSFMVNIHYLASFNKADRGIITLQSGKQIDLSRSQRASFLETLEALKKG